MFYFVACPSKIFTIRASRTVTFIHNVNVCWFLFFKMNFSIEGKEIVEIKCVDMKHLAQSAGGGAGVGGGGQLQLKTSPRINSLRSTFFSFFKCWSCTGVNTLYIIQGHGATTSDDAGVQISGERKRPTTLK